MRDGEMGRVAGWLRVEGLAALVLTTALYAQYGSGWLLFIVLLFAPDLTLLGYLRDSRTGAVIYNLGHSYTAPILLALCGMLFHLPLLTSLSLIWGAHVGLDRMVGYGLKLPSGFHDTHLGRIGGIGEANRAAPSLE